MRFDGREFARKIIEDLKKLNTRKKLVVFYNPEHKPSRVYTNIKERVAQELGVEFTKIPITKSQISNKYQIQNIKSQIEVFNKDKSVDGILIQLPLGFGTLDLELAGAIAREKDVDGLREDSLYQPAVVRAVLEILKTSPLASLLNSGERNARGEVLVVGSKGFVGWKLVKVLGIRYSVFGMDENDFDPEKIKMADVVISATGQKDLIDSDMVRDGFIAIDVGYPDAEFTSSALLRASFYTPVPGGVGPVTVACLFANLLEQIS